MKEVRNDKGEVRNEQQVMNERIHEVLFNNGAQIYTLIWLATCGADFQPYGVDDALDHITSLNITEVFGEQVRNHNWVQEFPFLMYDQKIEVLREEGYNGFLAQIDIQKPYDLKFMDGKLVAYKFGDVVTRVLYVERLEQLADSIEKLAEKLIQDAIREMEAV